MFRLFCITTLLLAGILGGMLSPTTAQQFQPGDIARIVGRVNVRAEPSASSTTVAVLEDGAVVTVTDIVPAGQVVTVEDVTSSLWYQVRLADDTVGYVWFGLLEESPSLTATAEPEIIRSLAAVGISPNNGFLAERLPDRDFRLRGGGEAVSDVDFAGTYSDFVLEMTIQWGPNPENSRCGVYFRTQGGTGSGYFLLLLPDQNLNFAIAGNADILDTDRALSDALRREPNSTNRILLVAFDQAFNVYVNGQFAARFVDDTYAVGDVGITALALDARGELSCRFSNTWLWQITDSIDLPPTPTFAPIIATPIPVIAERLARIGIPPSSGSLAFQRESISIGPLTRPPDQAVNEDFSGRYENFVLGADILWGPGGAGDLCGVYFGSQGPGELRGVMFSQWQELTLARTRMGLSPEINVLRQMHTIRVGPDAVNQLEIVVNNQTFSVYLNGEYVAQLQDETYQGGIVGVSALRRSLSFASGCEFRDIWLWELDEALPPAPSPTPAPDIVPAFIVDALASVGIAPDEGELDEYVTQVRLHQMSVDSPVFIDNFPADYRNFVLGTEFTWEPQNLDDDCGIMFRHDGNNAHALRLEQNGIYFGTAVEGEMQHVTRLSGVTPATDEINSLLVVGVDNIFSFYLNGEYIAQFQDDTLRVGRLGLVTFATQAVQATCTFTNTWIWDLGEDGPSIAPPTPLRSTAAVLDILSELGIARTSGYVATTENRIILNLTDRDNYIESSWLGNYRNFVMESTIIWGPGDTRDSCGVALRTRNVENFYRVSLNQQRIAVLDVRNNQIRDIEFFESASLRQGEGAANNLRLVVADDLLTIYLNGEYVAQYSGLETVGDTLFLLAETGPDSDESFCIFEDIWVWELVLDIPPILTPTPLPSPTLTPSATATPTLIPSATATPSPHPGDV